jgi:prepilin-type N-terminal cleavage/methylation domain-containing protein
MKKFSTRSKRNEGGFTLIELAIVIVIIGCLMAFFVNKYNQNGTSPASSSAAQTIRKDAEAITSLAAVYAAQKNAEITSLDDLVTANLANKYTPLIDWKAPAAASINYVIDNTTYAAQFGTAAADTVLILDNVTKDICTAIDVKTNLIAEGAAIPGAVTNNVSAQCFDTGGGVYRFLKVIYQH